MFNKHVFNHCNFERYIIATYCLFLHLIGSNGDISHCTEGRECSNRGHCRGHYRGSCSISNLCGSLLEGKILIVPHCKDGIKCSNRRPLYGPWF